MTYIFLKGGEVTFTIHDIIKFALADPIKHNFHEHPEDCIVDSKKYGLKMQILSVRLSVTRI
jgi:hypothetical protein